MDCETQRGKPYALTGLVADNLGVFFSTDKYDIYKILVSREDINNSLFAPQI